MYSAPTRGLFPMRDAIRALHEGHLYVYQAMSATARDLRSSFPIRLSLISELQTLTIVDDFHSPGLRDSSSPRRRLVRIPIVVADTIRQCA